MGITDPAGSAASPLPAMIPRSPASKARRLPGNKKNGGQEGYVGHTLESVEEPDHIVVYSADQCGMCGATLTDVEAEDHKRTAGSLTFRP